MVESLPGRQETLCAIPGSHLAEERMVLQSRESILSTGSTNDKKKWRVGGHGSLEETTETNASPFPPDFENPD